MMQPLTEIQRWINVKAVLFLYCASFLMIDITIASETTYVSFVYSKKSEINKTLLSELEKLSKLKNIKVSYDQLNNRKVSDKIDLIITSGTVATLAILKAKTVQPVIAVLIPKLGFDQAIGISGSRHRVDKRTVSAIYIDQPVERQAKLASLLIPNVKNVGIILSPRSEKSITDQYSGKNNLNYIDGELKRYGMTANINIISQRQRLMRSLIPLLSGFDVMVSVIDPLIFNRNNIQSILIASYRYRVPVIGMSLSYLRAGAVASVYSTAEQIARQLSEIIEVYEGLLLPTPHYPKYFKIKINNKVSRSFGLFNSDETLISQKMDAQ